MARASGVAASGVAASGVAASGVGQRAEIWRGRAWKYGDDIDTDVILPARYLSLHEPHELAPLVLEDLDAGFASAVKPGDILVVGKNFGCGSSREHAPVALKAAGVSCVIAASFARIFFRNAVNVGLAILECPPAAAAIGSGDEVEVEPEAGRIANLTTGETFQAQPFAPFVMEIIRAGGLIERTKARM